MTPVPIKPEISFEDFEKLDIRVGTIIAADEVPDSRKLVCLSVDFGDHKRQILSGIKQERDSLEELIGIQTLFVLNLPPRKMAGILSQGMLFDIGFADGVKPALAILEHELPNGSRAG